MNGKLQQGLLINLGILLFFGCSAVSDRDIAGRI